MELPCTVIPKASSPTTLRRRTNGSQIQSLTSTTTSCFFSKVASYQNSSSLTLSRRTDYQRSSRDNGQMKSLPSNTCFFTGDENLGQRLEKLKEEVRLLISEEKGVPDQLKIIDCLQQLGVAYHFEEEIKNFLCFICSSIEKLSLEFMDDDIYVLALCFRLLRENGFVMSKDLLVKSYGDGKGCFKPELRHDIRALISLYEASFLAKEGEDELEEAREFAIKHLRDHLSSSSLRDPMETQEALELPLHHRIQRLHARLIIEADYMEQKTDPRLLEFAKLDFNIAQTMYKTELKEIMRWRANLCLTDELLGFVRDLPVESYFIAVCLVFEPKFSRCRKELAKVIYYINIIDDIYDTHSSLEELELFTDVVDSFEVAAIESLPEYMKIIAALFNMVNDQARTIMHEKGLDILPFLRRMWSDLCKAYMVEARWHSTGYIPTLEEYLDNARISVAAPLTLVLAHCLSDSLTNASLESFEFYPNIVHQSSTIFRLYNDLEISKDEIGGTGNVPKSIQCYMNETNVSEIIARELIKNMINKYWKKLNGELISGFFKFEESFRTVAVNLPRVAHLMYQHKNDKDLDHLNTGHISDRVISLILEPIGYKEG